MQNADPIVEFIAKTETSLQDGTFVRLVLSGPTEPDDGIERITVRRVQIRQAPHLAMTFTRRTNDIAKNIPLEKGTIWLEEQLHGAWKNALLGTTQKDWQLHFPRKGGQPQLSNHKPAVATAPSGSHDRERVRLLDATANDWLVALGVVDPTGKVLPSMADKHRQINRYLEILSHLLDDCGWKPGQPLNIADMGCGKGYLTFAAWHWLRRTKHSPVEVLGVESRPDLVEKTNALAKEINATGLTFMEGAIDKVRVKDIEVLIALHACNTATDEAIRRGVEMRAKLIVVAPCCHKEVRPQLQHPTVLAPVLRHGVMEERMAEWATDGLRALYLEWAGYKTKVFEFVASEHTPKNLMIAAVRDGEPFTNHAAKEKIEEFKHFFGIKKHSLDSLLRVEVAKA
ncbi:MAG: Methyltransferase domain protein [Verrucomicrobia bacterium]|jgi:SAM-dependent methyltransferase|nr:Methyltransferase domain protein [Verrucomicrobiota bacterium]